MNISLQSAGRRWLIAAVAAMLVAGSVAAYSSGQHSQLKNLVAPGADAANTDYFLKLDGIPGDSLDAKHAGEIDVDAFSWGKGKPGIVQEGTIASGGGGGTGKATVNDISFAMKSSKASPLLMTSSATGKHIPNAVLTVRKAGTNQLEYFKITLTDVLVSSYQVGAGGGTGALANDDITLSFTTIKIQYYPQKADGTLGAPVEGAFDVAGNKAL